MIALITWNINLVPLLDLSSRIFVFLPDCIYMFWTYRYVQDACTRAPFSHHSLSHPLSLRLSSSLFACLSLHPSLSLSSLYHSTLPSLSFHSLARSLARSSSQNSLLHACPGPESFGKSSERLCQLDFFCTHTCIQVLMHVNVHACVLHIFSESKWTNFHPRTSWYTICNIRCWRPKAKFHARSSLWVMQIF